MAVAGRQLKQRMIGMTDGMYEVLRQLADERDPPTNVSELVRLAVEDYLTFLGQWDESYRPTENEARLSRHMPALGGDAR